MSSTVTPVTVDVSAKGRSAGQRPIGYAIDRSDLAPSEEPGPKPAPWSGLGTGAGSIIRNDPVTAGRARERLARQ